MNAKDATKYVIQASGRSMRALAVEMGKSPMYLAGVTSRGSVPKLDTFADIARACGYELILRGHDEEHVIEPNEQQE